MKLYYMPGACSLAAHIVLQWLNKPYETERVARDALKQPAYLAINPLGAVPSLTDGDWTLTQNVAILEYLAEGDSTRGLMGDGSARSRAEVRRWLGFLNSDVHKTFGMIFGVKSWHDDEAVQDVLQANAKTKLNHLFGIVDQHLAGTLDGQHAAPRDYLVGAQPSVADAYLYVMLRWAHAKQVDISSFGHLSAYFDRMDNDAGVQAALKDEAA